MIKRALSTSPPILDCNGSDKMAGSMAENEGLHEETGAGTKAPEDHAPTFCVVKLVRHHGFCFA